MPPNSASSGIRDKRATPEKLAAAFPGPRLHPVDSPVQGEIIEKGAFTLAACAAETCINTDVLQRWFDEIGAVRTP